MSKFNKILLALVVILLIALAAVIYWQKVGFEKPYWAVYLNTGDLYFGKLNYFPKLSLSDVWFIQRDPQDSSNPLSLVKFEQVFWGPENKIYLYDKNIIWKTRLKKDSPVIQFIKNSETAQPSPLPQNQQFQNQESMERPTTTSQ